MQAGVGLLVADVMPIYMIMPRYSHNYALFYKLLDSNLFTHGNTYAILREATSETYGPRVYFPSYKFPIYFILQSLLSNLFHKNTKNIYHIISLLFTSHLVYYFAIFTFQSIKQKYQKYLSYYLYQISLLQVAVKGLTTPLSRWLRGSYLFV